MVESIGFERSKRKRLLGASIIALTMGVGGSALAACLPDPPPLYNTAPINCSGVSNDGLTVTRSITTNILSGAVLAPGAGDDAAFVATIDAASLYSESYTLNVNGRIDGGADVGVLASSLPSPNTNYVTLNITVGAAGEITGSTAIQAQAPNFWATATISLDNSGQVTATSGPALQAGDYAGFSTVRNRQGGFIGGIDAAVANLINDGVIDGGSLSAYRSGTANSRPYAGPITNSGLMQSNGTAATIALEFTGGSIANTGQIINLGAGPAISSAYYLSIQNEAGGVISSAGPIAIQASNYSLWMKNRGTIIGSVVSSGAGYGSGSSNQFDNLGGTIQGDVLLGSSDDTLITNIDLATGAILGITGRIDGGGGNNILMMDLSQDAVLDGLDGRIALPTNFQSLQVRLASNATATFNNASLNGFTFLGTGKVVSNTNFASTTQGLNLRKPFNSSPRIEFVNNGDINFVRDPSSPGYSLSNDYALVVDGPTAFTNNGDIFATNGGKGLALRNGEVKAFVNNGLIDADDWGVSSSGGFQNNGVIRSRTIGVSQSYGNYMGGLVNTGTITGVTAGVSVSSLTSVTNSGVITSTGGVAVLMSGGSVDNLAGGVITGPVAIKSSWMTSSNQVANAGVINGDVDFTQTPTYAPSQDSYTDNGGTLNGSLLLSEGDDVFVTDLTRYVDGRFLGVTGKVDAGAGIDRLVLRIGADTTTNIALPTGFEGLGLILQNNAQAKVTTGPLTSTLKVTGEGALDLTADITTNWSSVIGLYGDYGQPSNTVAPQSIISRGALTFTQSGDWPSSGTTNNAVGLHQLAKFENTGKISVSGANSTFNTVSAIIGGASVTNSGSISLSGAVGVNGVGALVNTGTISQVSGGAAAVGARNVSQIDNSGSIVTAGHAVHAVYDYPYSVGPYTVTNTGVIKSTGADAIRIDSAATLSVVNKTGGEITSTTGKAIAIAAYTATTIRNDGVINGDIDLRWGEDRIENYGVINGAVNLGDGNDTFVQWVGGKMNGTVDGGLGLDALIIDSTGGGTVSTSQFVNFESFKQIGGGSINYVGAFGAGPILLENASAVVLAGDRVSTTGALTFSGGAGSEHLRVEGSISGGVSLGDGVDSAVNRGTIGGSVQLGAGDDSFTEGWGSSVTGTINGGAGNDTYIVELAGNRTGLRSRTGFENLGVTGAGNLTLTLDQNWDAVSLAGANLYLTSGGYTVRRLTGGADNEAVRLDTEIALVDLGAGDDNLQLEFAALTGVYAGGAGADTVRFTTTAPVTIAGSLSGFETIALDGGQMSVSGTLGTAGDTSRFSGDGAQSLSILSGGVLNGVFDLGAGDDLFEMAAGGRLLGTVLGGAGNDRVNIDLTSDLSLRGEQLQQFETLQVTGTGALNFTGGAARFERLITSSKDLTLAAGATLDAGALALGGDANTVKLAGAFSGVLDLGAGDDVLRLTTGATFTGSALGGGGRDRLELALGGTETAPIALGDTRFDGFETLSVQSGVISMSGDYGFDSIEVQNGRLIGLAGSRLSAARISVAQGSTFGSAGAVTGDVAVSGTLSPGASPGTMTVTGNVALASGSTALFEITPTVADKLLVSGKLTIAQGSTLKLVGAASLAPGRRIDLIVANGGIEGAFSTVDGMQGQNLHLDQSANRLQALGLFSTDTAFGSQISTLVGQLNSALIDNKVGASLSDAMSALADPTTNRSNPRALARMTPEAYASASQLAVENGLTMVDASRAQSRFAPTTPGMFGFGQAITSNRKLDGDAAVGISSGRIETTGGLLGVGYGVQKAWAGVFVGYLDGRQRVRDLDARTNADSFVVGAQGQVRLGSLHLTAMAAHDAADADTRRVAPGGASVSTDYALKSWVADVNLAYRAKLSADWLVQPRLGASYVRTSREAIAEQGGGAFALAIQGRKESTWFVDGQVELIGGQDAGARLHPFASLGFRSMVGGGESSASATLEGLPTVITARGLGRADTLATAGAGFAYDLRKGLTISASYAGEFGDGGRQAGLVGLNWKF
ncbi:hypothetical protein [Caulobacter endophyticus]|uniref:hypothetical protein n=1 Tax=Caulobacter endophyticus TaxID=2172652 RepID=UPI00240F4A28|nr:hypothetical protein [Caulobacter endophyticus]MDG2527928.1 hypothetical protein [Caulobacter endophyticus]